MEEGNTVGFAFVVHVWQKLITALISIWNIIVVVVVGFCLYLHGCYYYSGLLLGWLGGGFHQSVYLRQDIQTDRQSFDNPVRICLSGKPTLSSRAEDSSLRHVHSLVSHKSHHNPKLISSLSSPSPNLLCDIVVGGPSNVSI